MRISALTGALTLLGLAACSAGPGSYATMSTGAMTTGVGFGNYQRYLQVREAARPAASAPYSVPPEILNSGAIVPPDTMPPAPSALDAVPVRYAPTPARAPQPAAAAPGTTAQPAPTLSPITTQPLTAPLPAVAQPAPQASASIPPRVQASADFGTTPRFDPGPGVRPGVSDEQDFQAVSARESIASDRERLARQRAQYQVIDVATVPDASVSGGPNIVAYALNTHHAPGTEVHRRLNPLRWRRWESACLQFRSQDAAQEAFLANGGPERDPGSLDPDGDGYACWWNPTPLRQAMVPN